MDSIPIITQRAKIALCIALVLSIIDCALMLANFGFGSLFAGMAASSASIVHLGTHRIVIHARERRALHTLSVPPNGKTHKSTPGSGVFPPTSTVSSLLVTMLLALLYLSAFGVSMFVFTSEDILVLVQVPIVAGFDAGFQLLCAGILVWSFYVGIKERKIYLELTRRILLKDFSGSAGA